MQLAAIVAADRDASTVNHSVMKATEGNEILDVVVTANGSVVAMVQLHDGGGAAGPCAGAITGVHSTPKMGSDCRGATPEVERVAIVVLEHGLQSSVASEPPGCIATQHDTSRFEHIGSAGFDAGERSGVQQRVDRDMHNNLCGKP